MMIAAGVFAHIFAKWGYSQGMSRDQLGGIAFFMMGSVYLVVSITSLSRLNNIGYSITVMATGLIFPIYPEQYPITMYMGLIGMVGGLIAAIIMTLQLRRQARLNGSV